MKLDISYIFETPKNLSLSKGTYLVTDPCYVLGHIGQQVWDDICEAFYSEERENSHEMVMKITTKHDDKEFIVVMFNTKYGDGVYPVYKEGSLIGKCPVDAGMLSFIPKELFKYLSTVDVNTKESPLNETCGVFVDLDNDRPYYYDNGNATVGEISVITEEDENDVEEEEDNDEEYYEEESGKDGEE